MDITLRNERPEDYRAVENITREAFWNLHAPGCDEHLLVHKLRQSPCFIPELDFVAVTGNRLAGNIMYSHAHIVPPAGKKHKVLTFGPLSVLPSLQRHGIGSALVLHSLKQAAALKYTAVLIYGNPAYYSKLGFVSAKNFGISRPDGIFTPALMAIELQKNSLQGLKGYFKEDDVFTLSPDEVEEFEAFFPKKEKKSGTPSQLEFQHICSLTE